MMRDQRSRTSTMYSRVSRYGGTPWYVATVPGPALYAASASAYGSSPGTVRYFARYAASSRAAPAIAERGSHGSTPYSAAVGAVNCAMPTAPAAETAFGSNADSWSSVAARNGDGTDARVRPHDLAGDFHRRRRRAPAVHAQPEAAHDGHRRGYMPRQRGIRLCMDPDAGDGEGRCHENGRERVSKSRNQSAVSPRHSSRNSVNTISLGSPVLSALAATFIVLLVGDFASTFLYHVPQHMWGKLHLRTHHDRRRSYWDHAVLSRDPSRNGGDRD